MLEFFEKRKVPVILSQTAENVGLETEYSVLAALCDRHRMQFTPLISGFRIIDAVNVTRIITETNDCIDRLRKMHVRQNSR
jgi:hypothetical protein